MSNKIGVFICHCGINIAKTVDIETVTQKLKKYPGVVHVENYKYMCSEPGQMMIKDALKTKALDGVVVAACSPSLHETTFRRVVSSAGLNFYMCEIANIREQCSWVHEDREEATIKAKKIVKSVIERVRLNEPLTPIGMPVTKRALVIGGGIAGMQTALDIADGGYETILIEKEPSIGGHMAQLSETFPSLDCSQCILTPKMVDVASHPNIKLHTYSEVEELSGYVGNFKVKIKKKARSIKEEKCTGCGDCWVNCPIRYKPEIRKPPSARIMMSSKTIEKLDAIINTYKDGKAALIPILQAINAEFNYLPKDALRYVAEELSLPLSHVYRVATFFTAFTLKPRGRHLIKICLGTACYVRGSPRILSKVESELGIKAGETTSDNMFTLETVNCLGACAMGPLIVIDNDYHGRMGPNKVMSTLKLY